MLKINENKFFSATELKNNTKKVLDKSSELGEVIIMNNNKPKAVLMSIEKYNELNGNYNSEKNLDEVEKESIENYGKENEMGKPDFFEGDDVSSFLNNLK